MRDKLIDKVFDVAGAVLVCAFAVILCAFAVLLWREVLK